MLFPYRTGVLLLAMAGLGAWSSLKAGDGPFPADVAAWDEAEKERQRDAGREMLRELREAAAAGKKEIRIPTGHYRFAEAGDGRLPTHIMLAELNGVTIDFQGSTLWFETEASGIVLSKYEDVTVKNVFLDWDPLPFMQGKITAIDAESDTFDMQLDEGYDRVVPAMSRERAKGKSWRGMVLDRESGDLKPGQIGFAVNFSWDARNPDGSYQVKFRGFYKTPIAESGLETGDPVVLLSRMGRAVRIAGGKGCVLEEVTLYSSPFVGFSQAAGAGATFRRCKILRRPGTNRLLAGNADGINCANASTGPLIEDCVMETLGDDFVNVHGHLSRVIWQNSPTEIIASRLNYRGTITDSVEVEFLDRSTMRSLGRRKVTGTMMPWTIDKEKCLADLTHKWHSGDAAGLAYGRKMNLQRLQLDAPIQLKGDVIIACESFSGAGAVIRGCDFKGSLSRGIRLQSPGARIENNTVALTGGPALTMFGQAGFWGEGPYVHSATAIGNTFDRGCVGTGSTERASIVISGGKSREQRISHDIVLTSNRILRSPGSAIIARGVENLTIRDNEIDGYAAMEPAADSGPGAGYAIALENIEGLVLEENRMGDPGAFARGEVFNDNP